MGTQDYQELLKEHGMKATSQRLCILGNLEKMGHASLEEVYEATKPLYPTLSLTTIYRNLHEMMEKGLIEEVRLPKQKQRYEIAKHPHIHLVCESCGSVEDFSLNTDALVKEVEKEAGCDVTGDAITLNVICRKCKTRSE